MKKFADEQPPYHEIILCGAPGQVMSGFALQRDHVLESDGGWSDEISLSAAVDAGWWWTTYPVAPSEEAA